MTSLPAVLALPLSPVESIQRVELRCFTYEDRSVVMDEMLCALSQAGCWLESRGALSSSQIELCFVAMLGSADDLYGGLIGAGVEMTTESHRAMTWLCTLRRHRKDAVAALRTFSIRMEVRFLNDMGEEMGFVSAGMA